MAPEISLAVKYNVPVPRYTSYPTVPFWKEGLDAGRWQEVFARVSGHTNLGDGLSLYIHLPFCESLCTYCGCTKKITSNHSVEEKYIRAVLQEWEMYLALMTEPPLIREIHLGGGTPTFFSPANLRLLIEGILQKAVVHPQHVFSLEGHPNNTTREHLDTLYTLGFRRISYGVQDTNPDVQRAINRIQPFAHVMRATEDARAAGYTSVNFDLIYGLPRQHTDHLIWSIAQCLSLQPDRIAFYSYAHMPSLNCGQRLIDEKDLPSAAEKLDLYCKGKELFLSRGYSDIGMDHFALPADELYKAWKKGALHRNFMGYTSGREGNRGTSEARTQLSEGEGCERVPNSVRKEVHAGEAQRAFNPVEGETPAHRNDLLLGLGMSAISDIGVAYAQNSKSLAGYYRAVGAGELPVVKGYFLTDEDQVFRRHILDITCTGKTRFHNGYREPLQQYTLPVLRELEADGLVSLQEEGVEATATGRHFIRHIARAFDLHLLRRERGTLAERDRVTAEREATGGELGPEGETGPMGRETDPGGKEMGPMEEMGPVGEMGKRTGKDFGLCGKAAL